MLFDNIIMNPPYLGNLHLYILQSALAQKSKQGGLCCLHPARWIQDPLWEYKSSTDHERFQESIINRITDLDIFYGNSANEGFAIFNGTDLCITYIGNRKGEIKIINDLASSIIKKIMLFVSHLENSIKTYAEENQIGGIRCEIKEMLPITNVPGREDRTAKKKCVEFVIDKSREAVFIDGYTEDGKHWTETRGSGGIGDVKTIGDPLAWSIKFKTLEEGKNFRDSCRTNFYKNWIYLIKFDMHTPLFALPFMGDYTKEWDDKRFCEFFNLTKEEADFMSGEIDDYRYKCFLNYAKL